MAAEYQVNTFCMLHALKGDDTFTPGTSTVGFVQDFDS